jgi:hypothetical protein
MATDLAFALGDCCGCVSSCLTTFAVSGCLGLPAEGALVEVYETAVPGTTLASGTTDASGVVVLDLEAFASLSLSRRITYHTASFAVSTGTLTAFCGATVSVTLSPLTDRWCCSPFGVGKTLPKYLRLTDSCATWGNMFTECGPCVGYSSVNMTYSGSGIAGWASGNALLLTCPPSGPPALRVSQSHMCQYSDGGNCTCAGTYEDWNGPLDPLVVLPTSWTADPFSATFDIPALTLYCFYLGEPCGTRTRPGRTVTIWEP